MDDQGKLPDTEATAREAVMIFSIARIEAQDGEVAVRKFSEDRV